MTALGDELRRKVAEAEYAAYAQYRLLLQDKATAYSWKTMRQESAIRAVLAALAEPSEVMVAVGACKLSVADIYRVMIAEARKEFGL